MTMDGDDESVTVTRKPKPENNDDTFADLFLHSPVGLLVLDRNGVIGEINVLAAELIEDSETALKGQPLVAYMAPLSRDAFGLHLQHVFNLGGRQTCVIAFELSNGQRRDVELRSVVNRPN